MFLPFFNCYSSNRFNCLPQM